MTHISDTFTQGGQTQLHKLRMLTQVFGSTTRVSVLLTVVFLTIILLWNENWQYPAFLCSYYKAIFRDHMNFLPVGFFDSSWLPHDDGKWFEINDHIIAHHPSYVKAASASLAIVAKLFVSCLTFFVGTFTAFCGFWMWQGKKKEESQLLKGVSIQPPEFVKKLIKKSGASDIKIADIPMPKETDKEHTMICGTTGAGKTNAINSIVNQLRDQDRKTLIVDTTGNYINNYYREGQDYILNPFDARFHYWDLWSEAVDDYEYLEFADSLIPVQARQDEFWVKASRQLLTIGITTLKEEGKVNIRDLLDFLVVLPLEQAHRKLSHTLVSAYLDPKNEKMALSIRASMISALWSLQYVGKPSSDSEFSVRKWCENDEDRGWLFLSATPTQRSILQPLLSGWLSIAVKSLMARGEHKTRRLWFIIDELASLSHLPTLERGLAEVRKCGGCFMVGFQDINQLFKIYGQYDAQTILGLLGTQVVMRSQRKQADILSQCFGEKEVMDQVRSISFGANDMRDGVSLAEQLREKPVVSPTDIMMLDKGEAYVKFNGNFPYTKLKFPLASVKALAPSFVSSTILSESTAKQELESFKQEHGLQEKEAQEGEDKFVDSLYRNFGLIN